MSEDLLTCQVQERVRTKTGRLKMPVQVETCGASIEASAKVYLDVTGIERKEDGEYIITDLSFSHLNDQLDSIPVSIEELRVSCTEGHEITNYHLGDDLRNRIGLQPIGNAERTLGKRGGMPDSELTH